MNSTTTDTPGSLDNTPSVGETPQVFHCAACGECCHSWNLLVEGHKARALLEKPWVQDRLSEYSVTLLPVKEYASPEGDPFYLLPHRPNQTCVFLEATGRCEIHRREGLDLKPNDCQRYPFAEVRLPQGDNQRYDVSASCKIVAEDLLLSPSPMVPQDNEFPPGSDGEGPPLPERIPLFSRPLARIMPWSPWAKDHRSTSWETYDTAMAQWGQYFYQNSPGPLAGLAAFYSSFNSGEPNFLKAPPQAPWNTPFTVNENARSLPGDRWLVPWLLRTPYGSFSRLQYLQGKPFGDPKIFGPGPPIPWLKSLQLPLPDDTESKKRLNGYVFHILRRVKPLSFGHSIESLTALAIASLYLVRWYARVLSDLNGEPAVRPETLVTAIRLVERYYTGHQPLFLDRFRTDPWLRFLCFKSLMEP